MNSVMWRRVLVMAVAMLALAAAGEAWAKRAAPKPVAPVVHNGVQYTAPHASGREGKIVACDANSGKRLWELVVYTVKINPNLEEDVQWVFITGLAIKGDKLLVNNEKGVQYAVDLATRQVEKLK